MDKRCNVNEDKLREEEISCERKKASVKYAERLRTIRIT